MIWKLRIITYFRFCSLFDDALQVNLRIKVQLSQCFFGTVSQYMLFIYLYWLSISPAFSFPHLFVVGLTLVV